jgi:hypothetical protein
MEGVESSSPVEARPPRLQVPSINDRIFCLKKNLAAKEKNQRRNSTKISFAFFAREYQKFKSIIMLNRIEAPYVDKKC